MPDQQIQNAGSAKIAMLIGSYHQPYWIYLPSDQILATIRYRSSESQRTKNYHQLDG